MVARTGGSGKPFVIVSLLDSLEPPHNVTKRMGGDCTRVGQPGIKETGAHGGAPRTAAITRNSGHKKSAS
ncbi:hypothetical protein D3C75_1170940 [compost metagenome]